MSGFNAKTLSETFVSLDKGLIYTLATIIITALLTMGSVMITNKVINTNNSSNITNSTNENVPTQN